MILQALEKGKEAATRLINEDVIKGAFIFIQGQMLLVPASFLELIREVMRR